MPISKSASARLRVLGTIVAALIFIVMGNAALNFIFVPYGSKSEIMWNDYYEQEHIDAVFVGTSLAHRAFNPALLDKAWGIETFSMCTPAQTLEESFNAIKTAYREHGITYAVIGTEFTAYQEYKFLYPASAFISQKWRYQDIAGTLQDWADILSAPDYWKDMKSINVLSPWIYNHVHATPSNVVQNIKMKLDGTTLYEAAEQNEVGWTYYGKGYGNYDVSIAGDRANPIAYLSRYPRADFNQDRLDIAEDICNYCSENGISLIVINIPEPAANILEYGDMYWEQTNQLKELYTSHGATYYDFSFMKQEYFAGTPDYFADWQHMNKRGGTAFCSAFMQVVSAAEQGRDTSYMFYQSMDEYRASIYSITRIDTETSCENGYVHLKLSSLTGSHVNVEYRVLVWSDKWNTWMEVQPYSTNTELTCAASEGDITKMRIEARKVGSTGEYERYTEINVFR